MGAYARVIGAVRAGMACVVGGVGGACCGAFSGVVDTGEVFYADISVFTFGSERGVDCTAEFTGAVETGTWAWGVVLYTSYFGLVSRDIFPNQGL